MEQKHPRPITREYTAAPKREWATPHLITEGEVVEVTLTAPIGSGR